MIDYKSLLFGPTYGVLGVTATVTFDDTGTTKSLVVIDKSKGVALDTQTTGSGLKRTGGVVVDTLTPAAVVRMSELSAKSILKERLIDSVLDMNGGAWKITSIQPMPTPRGENDGELLLVLEFVEAESESLAPSDSTEPESETPESDTASDAPGEEVVAYRFTQKIAAAQWTINHNLGYNPVVYLTTLGGVEIDGAIQHTSPNQVIVTYNSPLAGHARLV